MRGGYRENAGRKQGFAAKNAEEARRLLSDMVMQEIRPIGEILISQAKKGNIQAIKELFDRAWGRSPQSLIVENNINEEDKVNMENREELVEYGRLWEEYYKAKLDKKSSITINIPNTNVASFT